MCTHQKLRINRSDPHERITRKARADGSFQIFLRTTIYWNV